MRNILSYFYIRNPDRVWILLKSTSVKKECSKSKKTPKFDAGANFKNFKKIGKTNKRDKRLANLATVDNKDKSMRI